MVGARALAGCLKDDGAIELMLYAKYGRFAVETIQSFCRSLALSQDERSVEIVRKLIAQLKTSHPIHAAIKQVEDIGYSSGIIDLFLHGRDRSYTVADCMDLLAGAGLVLQGWIDNAMYYPELHFSADLCQLIAALPEQKIWEAMEPLMTAHSLHSFVACKPARDQAEYRLDFSNPRFLEFVPAWRLDVRLDFEACRMVRPNGEATFPRWAVDLLRSIDGCRMIGELRNSARATPSLEFCSALFGSLWKAGAVLFRIPSPR